ncbi:LCP family protein, partial [Candidatus Falkowbacteria bacterium]|nr:LCP family protein [Candidatus Falkowbacteria bacterium]
ILSGDSLSDSLDRINIFGLSPSQDKFLRGESDDRINILLLGMGGEGHPGPYLTDTIIIVSIRPSDDKVAMISLPRDLSIPISGYGWHKINYANYFGEQKNFDHGAEFAAEVIGEVFDMPINYYARVDFAGFTKLIDELGGLKIYVDTAFTDNEFPTDDFGYQSVSFKSGWQKMDGQTALNYARSRHGTNGEASDFARSKRQQKVLEAMKDQAMSITTFLSYRKVNALLDFYKEHVSTNINAWEMFKMAKLAKKINKSNITNLVLDDSPTGLLYATNINGAFLLFPKDMSYYQLQQKIKYIFDPYVEIKPKEKIKVEVQNGTKIEGLAYRTTIKLRNKGYEVVEYGNCAKQDFEKTVIYDLSNGEQNEALTDLKSKLNANVGMDKPAWLEIEPDTNLDFLIILGQDQEQALSIAD